MAGRPLRALGTAAGHPRYGFDRHSYDLAYQDHRDDARAEATPPAPRSSDPTTSPRTVQRQLARSRCLRQGRRSPFFVTQLTNLASQPPLWSSQPLPHAPQRPLFSRQPCFGIRNGCFGIRNRCFRIRNCCFRIRNCCFGIRNCCFRIRSGFDHACGLLRTAGGRRSDWQSGHFSRARWQVYSERAAVCV